MVEETQKPMKEASEITAEAKKKFDDFESVFTRMDEDLEVWEMNVSPANITSYHSDILSKTKQHKTDINIVSNELRTNCDNVQSILSSADMQIMVRMAEPEGIDRRTEMGKLERLFYFLLEQGDLRLRRLLLPTLREQSDWHALVRGWRAARILTNKGKGNTVIANYTPLDPRWLVYEVGANGLSKVWYKTFKSKEALKNEWNYEGGIVDKVKSKFQGLVGREKDNEVIEYWFFEEPYKIWNAVVYKNIFLKEFEMFKIRSMPFSIVPVSTRPPIADDTGTKLRGFGESMFASARQIHAVRNRFATMMANQANLLANQPLIHYRAKAGGRPIPGSFQDVPGGMIELTMGEDAIEPSPMKEISPTVVNLLSWLSGQVRETLLPTFQMEAPPASGTRYSLGIEAANKTFNPQLRSLNHSFEDICRLIEEQLIDGGIKVKFQSLLKNKFDEVEITPVQLKEPHIIKVEFMARTPWTQMDTLQVAQMAMSIGLPQGWVWENIAKIQDPKGLADLAAIELFEHSPKGAMKRAAEALIETRGDLAGALSLIRDMDRMEVQEQMAGREVAPEGAPPETMPEGEVVPEEPTPPAPV